MEKVYYDKFQMACSFLQEGVSFCNVKRYVYFPYGCLDSLSMSFLGVVQAVSRAQVCCFTVERADKAEMKELVKRAKEAMKTAPSAEPVIVEVEKLGVDQNLPGEEQLKQYKALFVQGVLDKDQLDFLKKMLK